MFGIDDAALAIAGSSIVSGLMGSDASSKAADATTNAANAAANVQRQNYTDTRTDLAPYRTAGQGALANLMYLTTGDASGFGQNQREQAKQAIISNARRDDNVSADWVPDEGTISKYIDTYMGGASSAPPAGIGGAGSLTQPFSYSLADFYKDPSYQFQLDEGTKALTRGSAARGLAQSTPGLKSLMQWTQDYAGTAYSGAFNRAFGVDQSNKQTTYNFLQGIAGMGQNAAAMTGTAGTNAASGAASAMLAGGQATSAGILGSAQAVNSSVQGGLSNYMYNQRYQNTLGLYSNLLNPTGGGMPSGSFTAPPTQV